ncbi:hypothetical protein P0D87_10075 [Paraburkholderia sp. RL17-368-BIF-A]
MRPHRCTRNGPGSRCARGAGVAGGGAAARLATAAARRATLTT